MKTSQALPPAVLLIRVNADFEIVASRHSLDAVRSSFPGHRLLGLGTPQTATLDLLRADRRFDEVLIFPPAGAPAFKNPRELRRFLADKGIVATVASYGSTSQLDYRRHLLSVLLCPGRKYFMDRDNKLFSAASRRGRRLLCGAVAGLLADRIARRATALLSSVVRRRKVKRLTPTPLADLSQGNSVLWIRLDQSVGDVVLGLPALQAMIQQCPGCRIDALVPAAPRALVASIPGLTAVYAAPSTWSGWRSLLHQLRTHKYDLVCETRGTNHDRLLAYWCCARQRAGVVSASRPAFEHTASLGLLTHPVEIDDRGRHATDVNLELVARLGCSPPPEAMRLPVQDVQRSAAAAVLKALGVAGPYAVLHARPSVEMRQWSPQRFAEVADYLVRRHRLKVVLSGSPSDAAYNREIMQFAEVKENLYDATGRVPLDLLPALLETARIMVGVNTGPLHIAAAMGTPLVGLYLPWDVELTFPYSQIDGMVVSEINGEAPHDFQNVSLLESISVEAVTAAIDRKLSGTDGTGSVR